MLIGPQRKAAYQLLTEAERVTDEARRIGTRLSARLDYHHHPDPLGPLARRRVARKLERLADLQQAGAGHQELLGGMFTHSGADAAAAGRAEVLRATAGRLRAGDASGGMSRYGLWKLAGNAGERPGERVRSIRARLGATGEGPVTRRMDRLAAAAEITATNRALSGLSARLQVAQVTDDFTSVTAIADDLERLAARVREVGDSPLSAPPLAALAQALRTVDPERGHTAYLHAVTGDVAQSLAEMAAAGWRWADALLAVPGRPDDVLSVDEAEGLLQTIARRESGEDQVLRAVATLVSRAPARAGERLHDPRPALLDHATRILAGDANWRQKVQRQAAVRAATGVRAAAAEQAQITGTARLVAALAEVPADSDVVHARRVAAVDDAALAAAAILRGSDDAMTVAAFEDGLRRAADPDFTHGPLLARLAEQAEASRTRATTWTGARVAGDARQVAADAAEHLGRARVSLLELHSANTARALASLDDEFAARGAPGGRASVIAVPVRELDALIGRLDRIWSEHAGLRARVTGKVTVGHGALGGLEAIRADAMRVAEELRHSPSGAAGADSVAFKLRTLADSLREHVILPVATPGDGTVSRQTIRSLSAQAAEARDGLARVHAAAAATLTVPDARRDAAGLLAHGTQAAAHQHAVAVPAEA